MDGRIDNITFNKLKALLLRFTVPQLFNLTIKYFETLTSNIETNACLITTLFTQLKNYHFSKGGKTHFNKNA